MYTACVDLPVGPLRPEPRIAWYARYICELPSIRKSLEGEGKLLYIIRRMALTLRSRRSCAIAVALVAAWMAPAGCGGGMFGKAYEYEEDFYISLDGTAAVIVNASIPALVSLRGLDLNLDPAAQVDRDKIR